MNGNGQIVVFRLDDFRYGLGLSAVERVVRVVEITPLPKSHEIVLGAINFKGEIIPVVNVRKCFRFPAREPELSNQLFVARTSRRKVALLADAVVGVMDCRGLNVIQADAVIPGLKYVEGLMKLDDGLIPIHNFDTFLSLDEEKVLTQAMR